MKPPSTAPTAFYAPAQQATSRSRNMDALRIVHWAMVLIGLWTAPTVAKSQALDLSSLEVLHSGLRSCEGATCKTISDSLSSALMELLVEADPNAEIEGPRFMAAVQSGDRRLKVFTWNWAQSNRTSSYGGVVAFQRSEDAPLELTELYDDSSADAPSTQAAVSSSDWHGALYFDMVPDPVDKDTWMLLGWDDADAMVTRKVIEPIQIRGRGIRFGAPTLNGTMGMARRWVLEFADAVQVSLRYQPEKKGKDGHPRRIVFDHLAPSEPHLTGITAYYGPDMTFDAFVPGKKANSPWQLAPNTAPIQALPSDRPFVDPRPRNRRENQP